MRRHPAVTRTELRWSVPRGHLSAIAAAAIVALLCARPVVAQLSCDACDQCMTNCVCQADGSCGGTPAPDDTPCDDGNDCTAGDKCVSGTCMSGPAKENGAPCGIPGLGLCATAGTCFTIAAIGSTFCNVTPVICPDSGNLCQPNICDPTTGQCNPVTIPCNVDPCSTGECDRSCGCIPAKDGASCDDGNVCSSNETNQARQCAGTPESGTPQPTATAIAPPT